MGHLDAEELADAWWFFKDTGDIGQRNELVVHYTSLVKYVAAKIGGTLPAEVDKEDLISYGIFGLIDAIDKFDLGKGVKFETYGMARIRGAIYDEIRALDWVPRSIRSKARDIEKARVEVENLLGRPATHEEVAQNLGLTSEEYWRLASQAAATKLTSDSSGWNSGGQDDDSDLVPDTHYDPSANPESLLETSEIVDILGDAVSNMDERSKVILVLYYIQEMTLAEIGQILGVTESRVCQLQSKVLVTLRESLGQGLPSAA